MNTILTNDERRAAIKSVRHGMFTDPVPDDVTRAVEAAALAKLAQQEPMYQIKASNSQTAWHDATEGAYWAVPSNERRIVYPAPQQAVPAGHKLVPVEPTEAMVDAGSDAGDGDYWSGPITVYAAMLAAAPEAPAPHPDDVAVDDFAQAMKYKLASARHKGREGWQTFPPEELSRMLREHVEKGDPLDVANFCMFLWWLGHGIAPAQASAVNETWLGIKPCEVAHEFAWAAWQARAVLAQKGCK